MRGLVGGMAGGFLGSMLFRGMGFGSGGGYGGGGGGMGILEILLIAAVGFFIFRWFRNRQSYASAPSGFGSTQYTATPFPDTAPTAIPTASAAEMTEEDIASELRRYNSSFDISEFKEGRIDDFFKIQAGFMNRDLSSLRPLLAPELSAALEKNLESLKAQGRINRLENIAVRQSELMEGWQELGKEYATLRLNANLLDYTVDEKSGEVVSGSKTEPVKFEEYWTFVRDLNSGSAEERRWRLTAIENA